MAIAVAVLALSNFLTINESREILKPRLDRIVKEIEKYGGGVPSFAKENAYGRDRSERMSGILQSSSDESEERINEYLRKESQHNEGDLEPFPRREDQRLSSVDYFRKQDFLVAREGNPVESILERLKGQDAILLESLAGLANKDTVPNKSESYLSENDKNEMFQKFRAWSIRNNTNIEQSSALLEDIKISKTRKLTIMSHVTTNSNVKRKENTSDSSESEEFDAIPMNPNFSRSFWRYHLVENLNAMKRNQTESEKIRSQVTEFLTSGTIPSPS
mmetsp:Transcript_2828/g.4110  ORF Transcript_2828/g.4110 Transcript_2828/m.4110 type:complete len:275 (+) Transcript_2828:40-864(+)